MTHDEVVAATVEAVAAAKDLAAHLDRLSARMSGWFPLDGPGLARWDDDRRERLHALLRMFDQLYDLTTRKLVRGALALSGETLAGMSAQNQFRRLEAIGGLAAANGWMELGIVSNMLAHDYPTNPAAQAQRANRVWSDLPALIANVRQIIAYLATEVLPS